TRSYGDWSSDVCSSDLSSGGIGRCKISPPFAGLHVLLSDHESQSEVESAFHLRRHSVLYLFPFRLPGVPHLGRADEEQFLQTDRSEERRVGKECRLGW